jgi:outer membrane protein OmpA-like peptidoglycan-associated protein
MKRNYANLMIALVLGGSLVLTGCKSGKKEVLPPADTDGDGLTDNIEMQIGTDINKADTDEDGLSDFAEYDKYKTDPLKADTDGDGLNDGDEVNSYNTDPLKADTDGDGLNDGDEVNKHRTDPLKADTDNDGINDYDEINKYNTNPTLSDSDGDGFSDGQEVEMGTNPTDNSDPVYVRELDTVNFDFDKSRITDMDAQKLADNVEKLLSATNFKVKVNAYTDHVGTDQYNLRLSQRRASAVSKFYQDNGITEDRIMANGLGKAPVPCATTDANGKGCRDNRRADSVPVNPYKYNPGN